MAGTLVSTCMFCSHEHPTKVPLKGGSTGRLFSGRGFYLREVGQVDGRPVEVVTCEKHYNHVLSAGEYARMDALVESVRYR